MYTRAEPLARFAGAPAQPHQETGRFGQFLVRVVCGCGACREIEPEALARIVGWSVTLKDLALRMRCSRCGKKAAEVVAVARPRPRASRRRRDRPIEHWSGM
jgi:hypothetical protein